MITDQQKKVAIIVVTYNRKNMLKGCLEALFAQNYKNRDIILIDNASTDGTEEYIRENYISQICYFNTKKNLGGAGGFNYGMKRALEKGCDYLWLMDDDCIVEKSSLSYLLEEAKELKDKFGYLSSRVIWTDGSLCNMNIQRKNYSEKVSLKDTVRTKIIMATFVSFFIKADIVREIGLPISEFFIWADDLEYSRRISRVYPCYYIYNSVVCHKTRSNIGSNLPADNSENLSRYSYAYRNEYYLYRDEGIKGKAFYWAKRMYHISKIILRSDRKREKLRIIHDAVKEGKHFHPEIEYIDKSDNVANLAIKKSIAN